MSFSSRAVLNVNGTACSAQHGTENGTAGGGGIRQVYHRIQTVTHLFSYFQTCEIVVQRNIVPGVEVGLVACGLG